MKNKPSPSRLIACLGLCLGAMLHLPAPIQAQPSPPSGPGWALQLDGIDDYAIIPDSPALRLGNQFTIEFWFKPASLNQAQKYLLARSSPDTSKQAAVVFGYSALNQVEFYGLGYSGADPRPGSALTLPDAGWHHIAYSYDGAIWSGYLDGAEVFSVPRVFGLSSASNNWIVGVPFPTAVAQHAAGAFDEVRLWNVRRTAAQIQDALRRPLWGHEPGLAGYWRFDEGAGTTAADATGNAAQTATLVNGPAWAPSTLAPFAPSPPLPNGPGWALQLDGVDDAALINDSPSLRLSNQFTIEFWFKPDSLVQSPSYVLARSSPDSSRQAAVVFGYSATNQIEFYALGHTGADPRPGSVITLPDVGWHHIAYSYDGATWSGYLDGTQVFSVARVFRLSTVPNNWTVGTYAPSAPASDKVAGAFDEIRIWNLRRSTAQIQEALRRQLFGNESGLAGYWRFEGATGPSTADATGNPDQPIMLVNGPAWLPSNLTPFAPGVVTRDAVLGADGTATLRSAVFFNGPAATGWFQWGLATTYGNTTPVQSLGSGGGSNFNWNHTLTGLTSGATYHYRAVATNLHGPSFGVDRTFRFPATRTVQNTNDSGPGSLRQILQDASAGDAIVFAANVTNAIGLTSGELVIDKTLAIQGPGAKVLTVSGGGLSRIFRITAPDVSISGLRIAVASLRPGSAGAACGSKRCGLRSPTAFSPTT